MKLARRITGIIFCILLLFNMPVLAATNIQYVSGPPSAQEIISQEGDKLFLDKTWYDYKFEVNPNTNSGGMKMQQVNGSAYEEAINQVSFPLTNIGNYRVYFLSYKLKNYPTALALSFKDDSVVVFGTYYPLAQAKINQLAVHELGHQVDFKLMGQTSWSEYRRLRGLTDSNLYNNSSSIYENRPQEIFAEDFRLLFGGDKAREVPHLNQGLPAPDRVKGLQELFLGLNKA